MPSQRRSLASYVLKDSCFSEELLMIQNAPILDELIIGRICDTPNDVSSSSSSSDQNKLKTIFKRRTPLHPVSLSYEQVKEYEDAFKKYDINGDGVISVSELKRLLKTVGLKPTDEEVIDMIEAVDIDNDGELGICEFVRLMSKQHCPFVTPRQQFEAVFKSFDRDNSGNLNREEFKQSLFSLGQRCSELELESLMRRLDRNKDGKINKKEFLSVFLTGCDSSNC